MKKIIKGGLLPLPQDERDFSSQKVLFGAIVPKLPSEDFEIKTGEVKNQFDSDLCSAFSVCLASEAQEGIKLSPEWQFSKTKFLSGNWQEWGADLRLACKSAVKFGSLPISLSPFRLEMGRDYIANWENWPADLSESAIAQKKKTFFAVDGVFDTFDNIRASLWKGKSKKQIVITGALWRQEWTDSTIIPEIYGEDGFGHAFCFIGQKTINGIIHLIAQLSNGEQIGDKGRFYFPREVVNKECVYGNFIFVDMDKQTAKFLNDKGLTTKWSFLAKLLNYFNYAN